jgi:hypothetical protein
VSVWKLRRRENSCTAGNRTRAVQPVALGSKKGKGSGSGLCEQRKEVEQGLYCDVRSKFLKTVNKKFVLKELMKIP